MQGNRTEIELPRVGRETGHPCEPVLTMVQEYIKIMARYLYRSPVDALHARLLSSQG